MFPTKSFIIVIFCVVSQHHVIGDKNVDHQIESLKRYIKETPKELKVFLTNELKIADAKANKKLKYTKDELQNLVNFYDNYVKQLNKNATKAGADISSCTKNASNEFNAIKNHYNQVVKDCNAHWHDELEQFFNATYNDEKNSFDSLKIPSAQDVQNCNQDYTCLWKISKEVSDLFQTTLEAGPKYYAKYDYSKYIISWDECIDTGINDGCTALSLIMESILQCIKNLK